MASMTSDEVVKWAEQLPPAEQQALITRLQAVVKQPTLNQDEWQSLLKSITIHSPAAAHFSDRREDWYGDDGC
ncbi:MAG: hypothetical protein LCI00_16430 [Chloroflexi bacterium]|nr:hypothetical protein [Chloroflexota bacterium]MCC6892820.1 hypothetical protein [Anaerolineae bacterium]